jgi:D-inositol-3-phosphate glycosyltransferase
MGSQSRTRLAEMMRGALLCLVPSHSETFGLVALESAASGTPVVGFRGTGLLESVADGVSGVLLDTWEPDAWAAALGPLLAPDAGARFAASARRHALGFTWPAAAAALLAVYGSLRV